MRLIDADELIKNIDYSADLGGALGKVVECVKYYAKFMVASSPTIEERKTGKWIPHIEKSREYIGTALVSVEYDYWFCDACGYRVENGQPTYNFCPHCGADMR